MRKLTRLFSLMVILSLVLISCEKKNEETANGKKETVSSTEKNAEGNYVKVVYFHGKKRCATCMRIEKFSDEALKEYFNDELKNGKIVWESIDYDEKGNEHYLDDYNMFNQTLIVFRYKDGKPAEWKSCEKIWELNGDREQFINYVKDEVGKYLKGI